MQQEDQQFCWLKSTQSVRVWTWTWPAHARRNTSTFFQAPNEIINYVSSSSDRPWDTLPHLANKLPSQLFRSLGKVLKICTHCTYTALSPQILTRLDLESLRFHHTGVGMRWGKYVVVMPRLCIIDLKVHPGAPRQWNPFKTWGFGNHINHTWVAAAFKDMLGLLKSKFNC